MAYTHAERMEAGMLPQGTLGNDAKRASYGGGPPAGYPSQYQPPTYANSGLGTHQYDERRGVHLDWLFFGEYLLLEHCMKLLILARAQQFKRAATPGQ